MSKRGLSMEEKKVKLLEIFHENGEFFTFKELERIAPKLKGIVQQSVKDVLNEVTGDSLVQFDKIGTGNYYWSFPSAAGAVVSTPSPLLLPFLSPDTDVDDQAQSALDKAQAELESTNAKIQESTEALQQAQKGREDTPERRKLLESLHEMNKTSESLKAELAAFGAADPVRYERKKDAVRVAKEAAQRWTDNTLILMQFAQTLGVEDEQIRTMLGISDTWDDLPQ